jgi:2-keto-3-deoxy-6-phosphogluconate aldolase
MNLRVNATHTYAERGLDMYATPPNTTKALLGIERLPESVADPRIGTGVILDVLNAAGHIVHGADLVDRGRPHTVVRRYLDLVREHHKGSK